MAIISIKDLRIDTVIGIYDHELDQAQPLYFDIEMQSDILQAASTDNINDALDYHAVAKHIESMVEQNSNKLLEGLLATITKELLASFPKIESVTVTVRKPQAIDNAAHTAISHTATRA